MKRKINQVGTGTLTVSLPSGWAKRHKLKKGHEVEVVEKENTLTIHAGKVALSEPSTVRIKEGNWRDLRRVFGGIYRAGLQQVRIKASTPALLLEAQKALVGTPGYEFFPVNDTEADVKSIMNDMSLDVNAMINKMIHIVNTMHSLSVDDIHAQRFENKAHIDSLRQSLLATRNLVVRTIRMNKQYDLAHFPYYDIAMTISDIGGEYLIGYVWLAEHTTKKGKAELEILDAANKVFRNIISRSMSVSAIDEETDKLRERLMDIMERKDVMPQVLAVTHALLRLVKKLETHYSTLAASAMVTEES